MQHARMARPRSAHGRGLPPNLYWDSSAGLYRYRNPQTGKRTYLSKNKAECIDAANQLNAMLTSARGDLIQRVTSGSQAFKAVIERYEADVFPDLELGTKTRGQYAAYLRKLKTCHLANMGTADITVKNVVDALNKLTGGKRMRNVYRHQLVQVFRYSVELGWREDNPAEVTRVIKDKRERMRLTIAGFDAVYAQADPWLRVAMDLGLQTLQRREDLVMIRYSDIEEDRLHVRQRKTGRKLRIAVGSELAQVIADSRDGRVCPFVIHDRPRRVPRKERQASQRKHPMQVFPDKLTRAFRIARDASGYYDDATAPPPTFHEIRSLGADRYRDQGWSETRIQALLGHEYVDMTRAYLAGHEPPWEDVDSGLKR